MVVGAVFLFIFLQDPCNEQFRSDFSDKYPDYTILDFGGEGDTGKVFCHVFYQRPENQQIFEDIWVYENSDFGWRFSGIKETRKRDEISRDF